MPPLRGFYASYWFYYNNIIPSGFNGDRMLNNIDKLTLRRKAQGRTFDERLRAGPSTKGSGQVMNPSTKNLGQVINRSTKSSGQVKKNEI